MALTASLAPLRAQEQDTVGQKKTLSEVSIGARRTEGMSRLGGAENGTMMGQDALFRAACCNLGESFVANPAVDVNYSDAAVGARQIRLLGLSGQYVQMLCEGLPMSGSALIPYQLDHVPGAWMRSISVSKGTSSVKQGYQSITGQIDVEYLKPDEEQTLQLNLYGDSRARGEANLMGNVHLNKHLSTELLAHWNNDFMQHDQNGDLWADMPTVGQWHLQNRWKYVDGRYIMHAGIGALKEERNGGQLADLDWPDDPTAPPKYTTHIDSRRLEAYMKHAYLLDREHNTNIALTATAYDYTLSSLFGNKAFGIDQRGLTSHLMLEHDFNEDHTISTGLSLTADHYSPDAGQAWNEVVPGAYAQYTFTPSYKLTLMAGLRADYFSVSSEALDSRMFVTPRLHLKWVPADWLTLRASTGKGYRPVHPMAEMHYLQASGRTLNIPQMLIPEEAWNHGLSATFYIPMGKRTVTVNAEYYYTHFLHQAVVDYDSDPLAITVADLDGRSYSHTAQIDATYAFSDEWDAMAALRLNDVRCTYGGVLMEKPLQSRYKGLVTIGWKPMMALWQVDLTLQINGPGRMPTPYTTADGTPSWDATFPAYPQLNLQVTREFRHFSLYAGGENLTNYRQPVPVVSADNPWAATFEPTMVWGPMMGIMAYAGIRLKIKTHEK